MRRILLALVPLFLSAYSSNGASEAKAEKALKAAWKAAQ